MTSAPETRKPETSGAPRPDAGESGVSIRPLDPRDARAVDAVSALHERLLGGSPVVQLGPQFMRRFYYRKLVQDGLIRCELCYVNEKPAGFIAYTRRATDFLGQGIRRHWLYLSFLMLSIILRSPRHLQVILRTLGMMQKRSAIPGKQYDAEALSLGVLPEFRSREFVQGTGRRLSAELFDRARAYFREKGIPEFHLLVEAGNREAVLFYHSYGCRVEKYPDGTGKTLRAVCSTGAAADAAAPAERKAP